MVRLLNNYECADVDEEQQGHADAMLLRMKPNNEPIAAQ
jgi:hypothetical protein